MTPKPRVLFLCTHNSARSQMAEAFLRRYGGDRFEVHSAGLEPSVIHPLTYRVMQEVGIDLAQEGQRAKSLIEEYFIPKIHVAYMITVCRRAEENCPIYPGMGVRYFWDLEDPMQCEGTDEERLACFRRVRDQIEARVKQFVAEH